MLEMTPPTQTQGSVLFKDYLFDKFLEWEQTQPGRRSSPSAYARWLSENTFNIEIKQQVLNSWMKGTFPKEDKFLVVLAEKLGDEVYNVLQREPVDKLLFYVQDGWEEAPQKEKKHIAEIIAKYSHKPIPNDKRENSPTRPR